MKPSTSRFLGQCVGRICHDSNRSSSSSRLLFVRSLACTTNSMLVRYITYHESSQQRQISNNINGGHRASSSSNSSGNGILELTESEFHNLADETLDELVDWLTIVEESEELDADIVLSVSSLCLYDLPVNSTDIVD